MSPDHLRPAPEPQPDAVMAASRAFTAGLRARFNYIGERDLVLHRLRSALVTRGLTLPSGDVCGAVYDGERRLIRSSQRIHPNSPGAADPDIAPAGTYGHARRISRAIYGGRLFQILGHFLFESLARLWPLATLPGEARLDLDGAVLVFHPTEGLDRSVFFGNRFFSASMAALRIRPEDVVIADKDLLVDTLYYPDELSIIHAFIHPMLDRLLAHLASEIMRAERIPPALRFRRPARRIFLARWRWPANVRIGNEEEIAACFARRGFRILHPQDMRPADLLRAMRDADHVAAADGSQAHLMAFCRPGTRALLLDTRVVPTQAAITMLRSLDALHLPLFELPAIWDAQSLRLDPNRLEPVLDAWLAGPAG